MSREAYLLWGNHGSTVGIGEIAFTVVSSLSERYSVRPTKTIRPGKLNIIIDEFSNPHFVTHFLKTKIEEPTTKYVIVATEFITPISIFGAEIGRTFNFFWAEDDWRRLLRDGLLRGKNTLPSYMHQRYMGFMSAIPACDVLVFVHPTIGNELRDATKAFPNLVSPPSVIYPEFFMPLAALEPQLNSRPIGFNLTGTLTRYRKRTMNRLVKTFHRTGWKYPIWKHSGFDDSKPIEFTNQSIRFNYENGGDEGYLFNINPPQQFAWPFSSPMRILRAALLGQIPVVTKKFKDHAIEDISLLWDNRTDTALKVQFYAMDRRQLLAQYLKSIEQYNLLARDKNQEFWSALARLES
jgi:hypothetical protein